MPSQLPVKILKHTFLQEKVKTLYLSSLLSKLQETERLT